MVSVHGRISEGKAKIAHEVADQTGHSMNWIISKGLDLWLEVEAPVYLEAFKEAREKLARKKIASAS